MSRLSRRAGVDDDIYELAKYLIDRDKRIADRFVDAIQTTLQELAKRPGIGSRKQSDSQELKGLRSWRVKGFPIYLIFYLPVDDGIDVLAVLHGSRDVMPILRGRV